MITSFKSLDSFQKDIINNKSVVFYTINYAKHYTQQHKR